MSREEKIEIVKDVLACFAKGAYHDMLKWVADDIVWIVPGPTDDPFAGCYLGVERVKEGMSLFLRTIEDGIEDFQVEDIVTSDNSAVALGYDILRFKPSLRSVRIQFAYAMKFRDNKIVEFTAFRHHLQC